MCSALGKKGERQSAALWPVGLEVRLWHMSAFFLVQ